MHAFWLVLTYDLLEDRRIDDVIIKTFFPYILILYCIKQIDSKLPCVCSVIDHRWRQKVLNTGINNFWYWSSFSSVFFVFFHLYWTILSYLKEGVCPTVFCTHRSSKFFFKVLLSNLSERHIVRGAEMTRHELALSEEDGCSWEKTLAVTFQHVVWNDRSNS